jgi:hypothetical protein
MKKIFGFKSNIIDGPRVMIGNLSVLIIAGLFFTGCATTQLKSTPAPQPAKVKFSDFINVEMKAVGYGRTVSFADSNQRAIKKIDEILFNNMKLLFPNLKRVDQGEEFSKTGEKTLRITPVVNDIKFIGGAARFWVGALAGSSEVRMQATFQNSSNDEVIADSEFYRSAGAWAGSMTIGYTDNKMLEEVAKDVVNYCSLNK